MREHSRKRAERRSAPNLVPAQKQGARAQRLARILLCLILACGAFLRFHEITTIPPALCSDEAMNGNNALENLETGRLALFYPENGGREGLFINIQTAFVYLFGNKAWALRLPSAIFGTLTIWGVYCLAAELYSVPAGLLASFFLATSFWHINFSRIGLRAITSVFFLVWALYFLLDALRRARQGRPHPGRMAWAGAVYGLGFYTYIAYRASPPLIALILVYAYVHARRNGCVAALARASAVYALTAIAVVVPLALYFVGNPEMLSHRSAEISIFGAPRPLVELLLNIRKTIQMIFTKGDYDWLHNIAWRPMILWPVAILFALGIALGIAALYRRARRGAEGGEGIAAWFAYVLALLWLALGAVPAVLSRENMPNAIRSILMVPAIVVLAAAGGCWLYGQLARKLSPRWLQVASAGLLLALGGEAYHSYFEVWATSFDVTQVFNIAGANIADRINALPKTAPKHVIVVEPGAPIGLPPSAETVMFLTGSYTKKGQEEGNIHYITRQAGDKLDGVPFCQQVGATLQGDVFCLQVNWLRPPTF